MRVLNIFMLIALLQWTNCFKVLILTPYTIKSIHGLFAAIAHELAEAGHEVTFVSAFEMPHPKVEMLTLQQFTHLSVDQNPFELRSIKNVTKGISDILFKVVTMLYSDERVMELWSRRKDFDLFVSMSYFNEYTFPFLMDSKAVFVQVCTPGVEFVTMTREGNWLSPAVTPSILMEYDDQMNFYERLLNLPASMFHYYFIQGTTFPIVKSSLLEFFPNLTDPDSYYDRVALTLINGHFALDGPVPLLPSQIEIGTINAMEPQPLPQDLEDFVSGSGEAGLIYFSLGSIAKSTEIPRKVKDMFLEAFKRMPQRVLWKYEGTDLELPPNVKTQKWMPQQDILGHPKTRVFISHCGNLGTQEAKYHGVPVLAVPIAFDQPRNAARMARKGYALVLEWEDLTTDKIVAALDTLINDKSYKQRLDVLSAVLHDQKDTPAERAVWWLEYVVRHKGAPHLQYAGRRLSLFQYIMLDVILFWAAVLLVIILSIVYIIKIICCRKNNKTDSKLMRKKIR